MDATSTPAPGALDVETKIIHMGRAIRSFTSGRDVVQRLEFLGYSMADIMAYSGTAVAREYIRQIYTGERPGIITRQQRAPWNAHAYEWSAKLETHAPGDPVGVGETEYRAIHDLVKQMEALDV